MNDFVFPSNSILITLRRRRPPLPPYPEPHRSIISKQLLYRLIKVSGTTIFAFQCWSHKTSTLLSTSSVKHLLHPSQITLGNDSFLAPDKPPLHSSRPLKRHLILRTSRSDPHSPPPSPNKPSKTKKKPPQGKNEPNIEMSAPKAGRQSPDPETQSDHQVGASASGSIGAAPTETHSKDQSEDHKHEGLSSNPTGPLDASAQQKVTKDGRGDV